jgi:hypothetical protein
MHVGWMWKNGRIGFTDFRIMTWWWALGIIITQLLGVDCGGLIYRKGTYMVKSAYRFTIDTLINNKEYKLSGNLMQIWNSKIPQRVKKNPWRITRKCLPTRDQLHKKWVKLVHKFVSTLRNNLWKLIALIY